MTSLRVGALSFVLLLLGGPVLLADSAVADPCAAPVHEIACENSQPGNSPGQWDVSGAGDPSIQGFSTEIGVDRGETVHFKIDTVSTDYRLDIYRMGYYGGDGARLVDSVEPAVAPHDQPNCAEEPSTGLIDCGNWAESASWAVPADAVSGIYFAKLAREDQASGGSHIVFVVRDDDGGSELLFQTSDTTWQAYNRYGGNSLYAGGPGVNPARAYKVSYNRPLTVRGTSPEDSPFNAEYPMVRWLERNGYDVSYTTGVDTDRDGAELLEHDAFLSVGHDEYWTGPQRDNVEAARDAGVHLAFFSGNEVFWKTDWEDSIAGPAEDRRTLVCFKETHAGAELGSDPEVWTGTWRDPRLSPPADGGRPEHELTGTAFAVNFGPAEIEVPAADGRLRLWRDTDLASLAPGETATLAEDTLGYEWDEAPDDEFRPEGIVHLSSVTLEVPQRLLDYGSTYGPGPVEHRLTFYRAPSGALVFSAGTVQWSWGLDGVHDRGGSTPDPRMQQATVNLFADMGVQPASLQAALVVADPSADVDPPATTITTPGEGAEVERGELIEVSGSAGDELGEGGEGGEVGTVEVSFDGGESWQVAAGRDEWSLSWVPQELGEATILARGVDDSGNIESPAEEIGVEVVEASCPCSIWDESFTAAQDPDTNAVEVGVRFRADVDGYISGLRYYRTAGNSGPHVGRLWTAAGTPLATVTFTGETPTGWQQASLDSPVAIEAGVTYVAAYHAPAGRYASEANYFDPVGFDNPPLRALADGEDGPNGIFKYGPAGGLFSGAGPSSFKSENYLVDVVFEEELIPDTTPPEVSSRSPIPGAVDVSPETSVAASFGEAIDPATVHGGNAELTDAEGDPVPATVAYSPAQRSLTLTPDAPLLSGETYTMRLVGGPGGIADLAGNPLAADETWSFATVPPPPPPPDEGPGGPILVVANSANPFSRFYGEILRAEGLNEFTITDISKVTPAVLSGRDVVILGEGALSGAQAQTLGDWVQGGGNLIAMRPDPDLTGLLGLVDGGGSLGNAYLQVNTASSPGAGIVDETIQFHGVADRYALDGAEEIAALFSDAATPAGSPAVSLRSVGPNGGQAAAFSFDLARSIVYTRQGNPTWVGQERDGLAPIRSDDLFFGAKAGDSQPDWVDLSKVSIPQADEQQRLLTNLIGEMNLDRKPLPRFWFLPRDEKAAIVMSGDDHGHNGTAGRFDHFESLDPPGCVVDDWECVRATSYIYPNTPISDSKAGQLAADGFEIALHASTNCKDWKSQAELESRYATQLADFATKFPSLPAPTTNRTHCIVWSDWATQPRVERDHGIRLDTTYYYWPEGWVQDRPGMFTGSGMPMRFADQDGSLIDVYQAATQMTDESGQEYPQTSDALLDGALGPEGYYGVFTANMHTDLIASAEADAIIASAQARDVPIVSARQMLSWLDGRNQSSFGSVAWASDELSFTIDPDSGANGLRAMVPTASAVGPLDAIVRDGESVETSVQTIKGVEYAFFDALAGDYSAVYTDESLPFISNVQVAAENDGTATITWNTDEPADSRVDYGTDPEALESSVSDPALVTSHSLQLSDLESGGEYHFRVSSADAEANGATKPQAPLVPLSFTAPPPAPLLGGTSPASPANQNQPSVLGSAVAGSTVRLYAGAGCSGMPLATVPAVDLAAGVPVSVDDDSSSEFSATATSASGVSACSAALTYVEDSSPPETQIDVAPSGAVASNQASFSFSGDDPGGALTGFECRLDEGPWESCEPGLELSDLADGLHRFEVRAVDHAGNLDLDPASGEWRVDTVAPETQITGSPEALVNNAAANFEFTGSDPGGSGVASFECKLDEGEFEPCETGHAYEDLTEGGHSFEVRAIDQAGNVDGEPALLQWEIDLTDPPVHIDAGPDGLTADSTPSFGFDSEPGAAFECSIDTGTAAFGPCSGAASHAPSAPLADGPYTFRVRASDGAGNQATASQGFEVDATPPGTEITSGPPALISVDTAAFAFAGNDGTGSGVASFECKLDEGPFEPCPAGHQLSDLAEGQHRLEVRSVDHAGNVDPDPASREWQVDTQGPVAQITAMPKVISNSATASFSFTGDDGAGAGVSFFQCRRDSDDPEDWQPCTSALKFASLAEGPHTFEVRATDKAGNVGVAAIHAWEIDTKAPETEIASGPEPLVNVDTATFAFTGTDPGGSGVASFECKLDEGAFEPCETGKAYEDLTEGEHSFAVRAIDNAGNTDASAATHAWTVDLTPPAVTIDSLSQSLIKAGESSDLTWHANENGAFTLRVGGADCDSGTVLDSGTYATQPDTRVSTVAAADLSEGANTLRLCLTDAAGNRNQATTSIVKDSTAPETEIASGPEPLVNVDTATFSFTGTDPGGSGVASFECRLDEGAFEPCPASHELTGLDEGAHKLEVGAIDNAGNNDGSPAIHEWTVDLTPPAVQIDTGPEGLTNDATPTFVFGAEPGAGLECSIDIGTASFGACSASGSHTPDPPLADGGYSFRVRATDPAGNSAVAIREFTLDTAAPETEITSGPQPLVNLDTATFAFTGTDPGGSGVASFECKLDDGAFEPCETGHTYEDLTEGGHSFAVRAIDQAGNADGEPATDEWTVDTVAPSSIVDLGPPMLSPSADAEFIFHGDDAGGSGVELIQCRRDSSLPAAWQPCQSPRLYASLAEGSHTFEVRATDKAGNVGAAAIHAWEIDTKAPETEITSGPEPLVNVDTATFTFTGTDPGGSGVASFECRLDEGAFEPCPASHELTGLDEGAHKLEVGAIDNAGNADQTAAVHAWSVDLTPPAVTIDSLSKALLKAGETSDLTWHANENGAFELRVGGPDCDSGTVLDSGAYATQPDTRISTVAAADLSEGANTLRLCLTDAAGNRNQASTSIVKDSTAPETEIASGPEPLVNVDTATFTFTGTDPGGSGVASFECKLDDGAFEPCEAGHTYEDLTEGEHSFAVRAIDQAGNPGSSAATHTWAVDLTPPAVQIDTLSKSLIKAGESSDLTWQADENGAFSLRVGGADCDSGAQVAGGAYATQPDTRVSTVAAADLSEGANTLRLCLTDAAGNRNQASTSIVKDSTAPETEIASGPEPLVNVDTATFTFTGTDPGGSGVASFECKLDDGAFEPCEAGHTYEDLTEGAHSFAVRAIDNAGNTDASAATHTWTIDLTPPAVQISAGPEGLTNDSTPTFAFGAEPGASFECSIDQGPPSFGPCSDPGTHTPDSPLADGDYSFRVRATDPAGNQATAIRDFTLDTAAPAAPELTTTTPPSPANDDTPLLTGTAPAGATVRIFANADCSGGPAATVSPAQLQAGVQLTVAEDAVTSFSATATTAAQNTSPCSEPLAYREDSTAPETEIASGPEALINVDTATFAFTGTDPGGSGVASFECRLDEGAFEPCETGKAYEDLTEGGHSFAVRAIDQAGNTDASAATHAWNVDLTPPAVTIDSLSKSLIKAGESSDLTWQANENGAFSLRVGGPDCDSGTVLDSGAYATQPDTRVSTVAAADLSEGANTLRLCLTDAAGNRNQASTSIVLDSTAPETEIGMKPAALVNTATATFAFTGTDPGGSGVASFECRLDEGAFEPCETGHTYEDLTEGEHSFAVRAIDQAGNTDASAATHAWNVDLTPPAVQIDSLSKSLIKAGESSELTWQADENGDFSLRVGGPDCDSGTVLDSGAYATQPEARISTIAAADLSEGANTLRLCLTDAAGNRNQASTSIVKDSTAPETEIASGPEPLVNVDAATFAFTGADPGGSGVASFECRLDDGAFEPCEAGHTYEDLTEGGHVFAVRAIDQAGNADASAATHTWSVDLTPPDPQITAGPEGLTNDSTPTFAFGAEPGASFECSIDQGPPSFGPCSDPGTHTPDSPLADGGYSFRVRATDPAGNQATAIRDFTLDTAAPAAPELTATTPPSPSSDDTPLLTGSAPAGATVRIFANADCSGGPAATVTAAQLEAGVQLTVAEDAVASFSATATTAAQNTSPCSEPLAYREDSTAPETEIASGPEPLVNVDAATFAFTGADPGGSGVAAFECKLDDGAFEPCDTGHTYEDLTEGGHSFAVRAIDQAGNTDASAATHAWNVDLTPPAVTIDSLSKALLKAGETSDLTWHANENGAFELRVGGPDCDSGAQIATGAYATQPDTRISTIAAADLSEGANTLRLCLTDAAGNRNQATTSIVKDSTAPETEIGMKPAALVNTATATFAFTGTDPGGSGVASFECKLDDGAFEPCDTGHAYEDLTEGEHSFAVRAIDQAGNTDASAATHAWSVDLTPPAVQIDTGPEGLTNDSTPTFAFSAEPGASFECSIDQGPPSFGPCSAAGTHTPDPALADGDYSFRVRATDPAGNSAVATREFTLDTAAPAAPQLTATTPPSPSSNDTPLLTGSAPAGATVRIFANADCSGGPAATVSPAQLQAGVELTVAEDTVTSFSATATTAAQNTSPCSEPLAYREDSTAPETEIASGPEPLVNVDTATFAFTGADPGGSGVASFECRLDDGSFEPCDTGHTYEDLTEGEHSFAVRAIDNAGNTGSPAIHEWTVDLIPPDPQIIAGPEGLTNDATPTFAFSAEPDASFACSIDTGPPSFGPCSAPGTHTPDSPLADGDYTFRVRATDPAGNSAVAIREFTLDTAAPAAPELTATTPPSPSSDNTPLLTGSAPAGATVRIFANADCSGGPATTVTAAQLEAGVQLTVAEDAVTSFSATATTAAQNTSPCSEPLAYREDSTAPETEIASGPEALINVDTATFAFTGTDPGGSGVASFECRLDDGAFEPCDTGHAYEDLTEGEHSFAVRAIDQAGNADASAATHAWTVDLTPPAVTIDSLSQSLIKAGESSDLTWHANENGAFTLRVGGADCDSGTVLDSGTYATQPDTRVSTVAAADLSEGANTLRLCLTDAAGNRNQASTSIVKDSTAPETEIATGPEPLVNVDAATFAFTGADPGGSGVASFECRLDDGAFEPCEAGHTYEDLTEGGHVFAVRAIDQAGNADASAATHTWSVDLTPPDPQISAGPEGLTNDSTPTFAFSAEPGASFECSIDQGTPSFGPCSDPGTHTPDSPLADGDYSFRVRATDPAGNQATAIRDFTLDTAAPAAPELTATTPPSPSSDDTPLLTGSAPAGATVRIFANADCSGGPAATVAPAALEAGVELTVAEDAVTSFSATATTAAQNTSACSEPLAYREDSTAPETEIATGPEALVNVDTATFAFTGTDPGGSGVAAFECKLDDGAFEPCDTGHTYEDLTEGGHVFAVRAIDQAGNADASAATHAWNVDLTPPAVQIDSLSKSLIKAGETSDLTWHADENGAFTLRVGGPDCDSGTVLDSGTYATQPDTRISTIAAADLSEGANTLRLCLTDAAGNRNQATTSIVKDSTAPETEIGMKPAALVNTATATFAFTGTDPGGSGVASFECRLDEGAFEPCETGKAYEDLTEGGHSFAVRAIDQAGNTDASAATHAWTVDLTPPDPQIDTGPEGLTNDSTPTFAFSAEPGASFECSIDQGPPSFGPCSAAGTHTPDPALADGDYSFRVRATDPAGNSAVAIRDFTLDTAAPAAPELTATTPPSPANDDTPLLTGTAPAGATVRIFANADCSGGPATTVSPAQLQAGVELTVAEDTVTSFSATATTAAQNTSPCSEPLAYREDSTAPETEIATNPAALVNSATANFTFTGTDPGGSGVASFECRLDPVGSAGWVPCSSPHGLTGLSHGHHTFQVRAIDNAGNIGSADSFGWNVDLNGPQVVIDSLSEPLLNVGESADLTWHANENGAFALNVGGADCEAGVQIAADVYSTQPDTRVTTVAAADLPEGQSTLRLCLTDAAGNRSSATRTIEKDTTAPDTQLGTKPAALVNSATASFSFTGTDPDGSGVASFACKLDSGSFEPCTSPREYTGLGEGPHTVEVRAIDAAGNTDASPAVHNWTIDLTPPAVQIDSGPEGLTNEATPTFAFGAPGASFECSVDDGTADFGPCSAAGSHTPDPALADGAWTFRVRATDAAGNQATATRGFTVDATAPEVQVDAGPSGPTNDPTPTFAFSAPGAKTLECSIDEGTESFGSCSDDGSHTPAAPLAAGEHTFRVRATDAIGNEAEASRSFMVDVTPPDTQIGTKPSALTNSTSAAFSFTGTDPGGSGVASFECKLDGTAFASCASPTVYSALADGAHGFEVRAIDAAGNVDQAPATHAWSIDTSISTEADAPASAPSVAAEPAPDIPSEVRFVRIRHNPKSGVALLVFEVPGPGLLSARAPELTARETKRGKASALSLRKLRLWRKSIKLSRVRVTGAGLAEVPVALTPAGQSLLQQSRRLKVKVVARFKSADGDSATWKITVTLRKVESLASGTRRARRTGPRR